MPDAPLPPCGPERDRLAAEAVGWTAVGQERYHRHTESVNHGVRPGKPGREAVPHYSTNNADALALLEAWCHVADGTRSYGHSRYSRGVSAVMLFKDGVTVVVASAPTFADAATAAVIRAERGSA